jgi:hypothetical protein
MPLITLRGSKSDLSFEVRRATIALGEPDLKAEAGMTWRNYKLTELYIVAFVMQVQESRVVPKWTGSSRSKKDQPEPWMTKSVMELKGTKETKREQTETGQTGHPSQGKPWEPLR